MVSVVGEIKNKTAIDRLVFLLPRPLVEHFVADSGNDRHEK